MYSAHLTDPFALLGPEHTGHFVEPHVAAHCGGDINFIPVGNHYFQALASTLQFVAQVCGRLWLVPATDRAFAYITYMSPPHVALVCSGPPQCAATCGWTKWPVCSGPYPHTNSQPPRWRHNKSYSECHNTKIVNNTPVNIACNTEIEYYLQVAIPKKIVKIGHFKEQEKHGGNCTLF